MFGGIVLLLVSGGIVFGLKKLLIDHPEKLERFMCRLWRTTYPPPADWTMKYQIGKMKFLLWALLVLSALTVCLATVGLVASILLSIFHR